MGHHHTVMKLTSPSLTLLPQHSWPIRWASQTSGEDRYLHQARHWYASWGRHDRSSGIDACPSFVESPLLILLSSFTTYHVYFFPNDDSFRIVSGLKKSPAPFTRKLDASVEVGAQHSIVTLSTLITHIICIVLGELQPRGRYDGISSNAKRLINCINNNLIYSLPARWLLFL